MSYSPFLTSAYKGPAIWQNAQDQPVFVGLAAARCSTGKGSHPPGTQHFVNHIHISDTTHDAWLLGLVVPMPLGHRSTHTHARFRTRHLPTTIPIPPELANIIIEKTKHSIFCDPWVGEEVLAPCIFVCCLWKSFTQPKLFKGPTANCHLQSLEDFLAFREWNMHHAGHPRAVYLVTPTRTSVWRRRREYGRIARLFLPR
ncbi:hypothetical protein C8Q77DRAFT_1090077 [Trametes polyzona]|nr:hypothetical protein C8Q77DRAFT_1090077 [Trametes polyzona]